MPAIVRLSGGELGSLNEDMEGMLTAIRPAVVGVASAFVSVDGVSRLARAFARAGNPHCRLIAGIDHAITHPRALSLAIELGWELRLGKGEGGIFHPKFLIGGGAFSRGGGIKDISCLYVGSSNLTGAGFEKNIECGVLDTVNAMGASGSDAFSKIWSISERATDRLIRSYSSRFAELSRKRKPSELVSLGVSDDGEVDLASQELRERRPPAGAAVGVQFAATAWVGLQSFTGEYKFQIEFPRNAGQVISRFISEHGNSGNDIEVFCQDDAEIRQMSYRFYSDNSMFRLNVPNDVPGVQWVRQNHNGIAVVERGPVGGAPLRLRIVRPGVEMNEFIGRSVALGSWGRTSTRIYGWF